MIRSTKQHPPLSASSTVEVNDPVLHELNELETRNLRSATFYEIDFRSRISEINYFGQVAEVVVQGTGSGPTSGTDAGLLRPPFPPAVWSVAIAIPATPNTTAITPRVMNFFMNSLQGQDK